MADLKRKREQGEALRLTRYCPSNLNCIEFGLGSEGRDENELLPDVGRLVDELDELMDQTTSVRLSRLPDY